MTKAQENAIQTLVYSIQSWLDDLANSRCLDVRANVAAKLRKDALLLSVAASELAYVTNCQLKGYENDTSSNL